MGTRKVLGIILLVWLVVTFIGGFTLRAALPGQEVNNTKDSLNNGVRIGLFADPHLADKMEGTETDIVGTSYEAPKDAKLALNSINADYLFGLGDLTAHSLENEWIGYDSWENDLKADNVFDILGNHDRNHLHNLGSYGTEYFTKVGRVSGTKVLKMGNNVFILISEEHDWESDGDKLMSSIPDRTFEYVRGYLEKYSENNNVFVMSHTPISKTNAFSYTWFYGSNEHWVKISEEYKDLLDNFEVTAHLSGHVHTDYRQRDDPLDEDGTEGAENVGKFISGGKINASDRVYSPKSLPEAYFLNMPVVDYAHNWIGARFAFLSRLVDFENVHPATQLKTREEMVEKGIEGKKGPNLFDFFHSPQNSIITGRGAVYYFEMQENDESLNIVTRWIGGNQDVEEFEMKLDHPLELGDENMHFVSSMLSLRRTDNLEIERDNWFRIDSGMSGMGVFSKKFSDTVEVSGVEVESYNLKNYSVEWTGSLDGGDSWQEWQESPDNLGEVNAIKIRVNFESPDSRPAYVEDINLITD